MMPDMDGITTCEKIREIPDLDNVIITFLTARNEDYSEIAGLKGQMIILINQYNQKYLLRKLNHY